MLSQARCNKINAESEADHIYIYISCRWCQAIHLFLQKMQQTETLLLQALKKLDAGTLKFNIDVAIFPWKLTFGVGMCIRINKGESVQAKKFHKYIN